MTVLNTKLSTPFQAHLAVHPGTRASATDQCLACMATQASVMLPHLSLGFNAGFTQTSGNPL